MNEGYYTISRKIKNNFLYPTNENRKFTKYEAWLWIIENSYFFCCEKFIDGKFIVIPRGYFDTTIEQLAFNFKWDRRTTENFIRLLENQQQIRRFKVTKMRKSCTLIKVNNYNVFQPIVEHKCTLKCKLKCKSYCKLQCKLECTPNNKEIKKEINKEIKYIKEETKKFIIPTIEQIKEYCSERNNKIDAETFFNYYQSKGWMIGKNKMKDWKACIRTWEAKDKEKDSFDSGYYSKSPEEIPF